MEAKAVTFVPLIEARAEDTPSYLKVVNSIYIFFSDYRLQSRGLDVNAGINESFGSSQPSMMSPNASFTDKNMERNKSNDDNTPEPICQHLILDRAITERPPINIPSSKIIQNFTKSETENKRQKIAITSFIRSNCVYLRDADEGTNSRYKMVHNVVQQLSQNLSRIRSLPEAGTFLIVNVNGFKRCTILDVRPDRKIKVFLSDFGQQEIVTKDQLYEPGSRLEKLASASFIKMLRLENVPEFYLNKKAAKYTKSLLKDDVFLEFESGSNPEEGRIFDVIKNEYVNDVLFCYSQENEPQMVEYEPEDKEFTFINEEIIKSDVSFFYS